MVILFLLPMISRQLKPRRRRRQLIRPKRSRWQPRVQCPCHSRQSRRAGVVMNVVAVAGVVVAGAVVAGAVEGAGAAGLEVAMVEVAMVEGAVAEGTVAEGTVAEGAVAEGAVVEVAMVEGTMVEVAMEVAVEVAVVAGAGVVVSGRLEGAHMLTSRVCQDRCDNALMILPLGKAPGRSGGADASEQAVLHRWSLPRRIARHRRPPLPPPPRARRSEDGGRDGTTSEGVHCVQLVCMYVCMCEELVKTPRRVIFF